MPDKPFTPDTVTDFLHTFELGIHSGVAAELLPPNQLAFAINCTVRGTFVTHRPTVRKYDLSWFSNAQKAAFEGGLFQAASFYQDDALKGWLMAAVSGHLYRFNVFPSPTAMVVDDVTGANTQSVVATQEWLWQSEKWLIWNDGASLPVFWDGAATARSGFVTPGNFTTTNTIDYVTPAVGASAIATFADTTNMPVGTFVTCYGLGRMQVIVSSLSAPGTATLQNFGEMLAGINIVAGSTWAWKALVVTPQLPAGRMGAYVMGRNWMSLPDAKAFIASDLLGGSSGTIGQNYRDAVLRVTENSQLGSGGTFAVPGSVGDIRAIVGAATLDVSMGQGPVQIITPFSVFTCAASTDRTTWQETTNPILTQAIITYGGLAQASSIIVNGDTFYRSPDGWRSLVIGRRDFFSWGNTPLSFEVDRVLNQDNLDLLQFSGAIVFNNRFLGTANPIQVANHGTYHLALVSLNFDPISALGKKAPSVWEGMWTGLNVLQMVKGIFEGVERMFAFTLNILTNKIEVYEFLPSGEANYDVVDGNNIPIIWEFETPKVLRDADPRERKFKRLLDGELMVDQLVGTVDFQVFYRPDDYPCWVLWHSWSECASETSTQPQFRPRMGFGEPTGRTCDPSTNRPLREGYDYQLKFVIRGHCRVTGIRVKAVVIPDPTFAKPQCNPCPT